MNYVKYTDSPKVDDVVGFTLETYDDDGVLKNPDSIEKVIIYYIENNAGQNNRTLSLKSHNPQLEITYQDLKDNVGKEDLVRLHKIMQKTASTNKVHYSDSKIVMRTESPIWNDKIKKIENIKISGKSVLGNFLFFWKPVDMREGMYLIRWDWKVGNKLRHAEKVFTLHPSEQKINSIYSKFVPREKYHLLFDKYIPQMYRVKTTPVDVTPETLVKFNKAVAQTLLELDDLAVGLADLLNPTFIPEGFLPVMANMFNITLRSKSVASWRNQIKHAIPLFKKKGTLASLREALDVAGIKLLKLTNLWQVISPYTWVDGFLVEKDISTKSEIIGYLTKQHLDTDEPDFEVSIRSNDAKEYYLLPKNIVFLQEIQIPEPRVAVIWNGEAHQPPIELFKGDVLRIRYKYNKIPEGDRTKENYLRNLPLADQRDESNTKYPLKNWNVKLLEEDDPLFNLLIPERHPLQNPVVYGKIRTTFLYSEKAFNMDTYNGSLSNSNNPCDMDKDFADPCSGGQSSKFNVVLEFDKVDDDKIREAKEIIEDYSPFHASLHNMKINSKLTDFILPPIENIKSKVKNKKPAEQGDKIGMSEQIYCEIRYKDGKKISGRVL